MPRVKKNITTQPNVDLSKIGEMTMFEILKTTDGAEGGIKRIYLNDFTARFHNNIRKDGVADWNNLKASLANKERFCGNTNYNWCIRINRKTNDRGEFVFGVKLNESVALKIREIIKRKEEAQNIGTVIDLEDKFIVTCNGQTTSYNEKERKRLIAEYEEGLDLVEPNEKAKYEYIIKCLKKGDTEITDINI